MSIQVETSKDAGLLARLNHDVQELHSRIEPGIFKPHSLAGMKELFEDLLKDENHAAYIAYCDDSPAGYILLCMRNIPETQFRYGYSVIYVEQICVDGKWKGSGAGKALIAAAKEYAKQKDVSRIELDFWSKNENAGEFFYSQGFRAFNERMYLDCTT